MSHRIWTETTVARQLGISIPIVQGPFGGNFSTARLTATVSNCGGLGSFGAQAFPAAEIRSIIADIRAQTSKPFAINLWVSTRDEMDESVMRANFQTQIKFLKPFCEDMEIPLPNFPKPSGETFEQQVEAVLDLRPPVLSFVFGIPAPEILHECRRRNIVTVGAATTVAEALVNEAAGVDIVVATGSDAGGHRPSFLKSAEASLTGTMSLLPQVADAVKIPVIAAGGIADGRGVVAALKLGAGAVQIGTAFLACEESGASAFHKSQLFGGNAIETILTRACTGRLARFIRNRFITEWERSAVSPLPFPLQNELTAGLRAAAVQQQRADLAALYAGQAASLLKHRQAETLFRSLVEDTNQHWGICSKG
ncbi:MAG: nitronate monooxygenase [Verrucomicrobiota bacterium]